MLCFEKKDPNVINKVNELKLWYSMSNDGAGGCTFNLYESEKLAEWVEENEDEGFGESTVNSISIESDSYIHIKETVITIDSMIEDMEEELTEKWSNKTRLHNQIASLKVLKEK